MMLRSKPRRNLPSISSIYELIYLTFGFPGMETDFHERCVLWNKKKVCHSFHFTRNLVKLRLLAVVFPRLFENRKDVNLIKDAQ